MCYIYISILIGEYGADGGGGPSAEGTLRGHLEGRRG